jgi:hypothetical protein
VLTLADHPTSSLEEPPVKAQLSSAALAIVLTGALCACGSGSKSSTESSAANAGTAAAVAALASSGASTAASQSSTAKSIDICTAVPPATVVQLTGKQYTVATPGVIGLGLSCAYDDVDYTDDGVTLSYSATKAEDTWQALHTGSLTDISGVGDKAFWDNSNTLYAVSGSTIIQVNGLDSQSASVALAKALLAALH